MGERKHIKSLNRMIRNTTNTDNTAADNTAFTHFANISLTEATYIQNITLRHTVYVIHSIYITMFKTSNTASGNRNNKREMQYLAHYM